MHGRIGKPGEDCRQVFASAGNRCPYADQVPFWDMMRDVG